MENGLTLHLEGVVISKPYINLTLQLMEQYGVKAEWNGQTIKVRPQDYHPIPFTVESDWSAASYWYSMMALSKMLRSNCWGCLRTVCREMPPEPNCLHSLVWVRLTRIGALF